MPLDLLKGRSKKSFASSSARENVPVFGVLGSQARRACAMQQTWHGERTHEELPTGFAERVSDAGPGSEPTEAPIDCDAAEVPIAEVKLRPNALK